MNTNDKGSHVLKKLLFSEERAFLLFVFAFLSLILAACGRDGLYLNLYLNLAFGRTP